MYTYMLIDVNFQTLKKWELYIKHKKPYIKS